MYSLYYFYRFISGPPCFEETRGNLLFLKKTSRAGNGSAQKKVYNKFSLLEL